VLSEAQYISYVTLNPSENRLRPVTLQIAQLTRPEQSYPPLVGPEHDPPPKTYGVPFAVSACARTFWPMLDVGEDVLGAIGSADEAGLFGAKSYFTQHWMSSSPGQKPAWKSPPEQPLLLLLRQYPELLPVSQVMLTQHYKRCQPTYFNFLYPFEQSSRSTAGGCVVSHEKLT
jgi:hypothetical protein